MTQPGRAAIEIIGDVSKLGPQVERDVQRALDNVDVDTREIADDLARGFREGARDGIDALSDVERQAEQTSKKVIKSTDAAGNAVERTFKTIAREGRVTTTVIEKSFDAAGDEIERTFKFAAADVAQSAELIALVNRTAADSAADSWERAGERIERAFAEARREAVVDQAEIAAAATASAATVTKQGNTITRVFGRIGDGIAGAAAALGSLVLTEVNPAGLAASLLTFAAAAAAVVVLAGPLLTLSAAVAQLAGALALLPSAGFAAALAIGTLVIAFNGFGDAVGAIIKGDPEKIAEALKKLAPAARAVALEFQKLLPAFREVGQLVQQRFFVQLEGDLTRLTNSLLPTFRAGLSGLATQLGTVLSRIGETLSTPTAAAQFKTIFDEVGGAIKDAADDFDRLVAGLLSAAAALAPSFGDISATLTDIIGDFGDWLRLSAEDGSLQAFLDGALETARSLLHLFGAVGGLIGTLFGGNAADEGRSFLDTITQGINDLNDALQSEEGQKVLQEIITSARVLGIAFGFLIDVIGFFVDVLAKVHDIAVDVADFFERAGNDIERFWNSLTSGASDAASALGDFWDGLVQDVSGAIDSVIAFFQGLPGQVVGFLESLPGQIVAVFDMAINQVIDTVALGIAAAIVFVTDLPRQVAGAFQAVLDFLATVPDRIGEFWDMLVQEATSALTSIGEFALDVWNDIVDFASQLPDKIGKFFSGIFDAAVEKLTALVNWVKGLPQRIVSALGDLGSLLFNAGSRVIQGLIDGVASKFERLKQKIAEGVQLIRDHLPFSPAKTGPLSGSGSPDIAGAKIAEMIAAGLDSNLPLIAGAAARAAGATQLGTPLADAGGLPLVTPQQGQPGTVLSPVGTTSEQQQIFVVQIGNDEIGAYISKRVDEVVQVEVRRLVTGARGVV